MTKTKMCCCIGAENCNDLTCPIVRNHRAASDRAEERMRKAMEKIFDQFVAELEDICMPDDEEYQELEDKIVGEEENQETAIETIRIDPSPYQPPWYVPWHVPYFQPDWYTSRETDITPQITWDSYTDKK